MAVVVVVKQICMLKPTKLHQKESNFLYLNLLFFLDVKRNKYQQQVFRWKEKSADEMGRGS